MLGAISPANLHKRKSKFAALALCVYLLTYVCLSTTGMYVLVNHGGSDWSVEWHPKYLACAYVGHVGRTKTRLTAPGLLFWPCVLVDRCLWHRTYYDGGF
jgi:hypothetical protein